jgi:hypothetical protein
VVNDDPRVKATQ